MSKIEILDDDAWLESDPWGWQRSCPCGHSLDDSQHARAHLLWACGVPLPYSLWGALVVVNGRSLHADRKVAYEMGRLFRREEGHDFVMLPAPSEWKRYPDQPRAYLAVWRERVIAIAIVGHTELWGWDKQRDDHGYVHFTETTPCPAIVGIFVCNNYRKRGVGTRLVTEVAKHEGVPIHELAWTAPLSEGGRHLAKRAAGDMIRLCGGIDWD